MSKIASQILLICLVFFLSGSKALSAEGNDSDQLIKLGLMTELSGPAALIGQYCKDGFELARKELAVSDRVGKYRIEAIYEDTQGLPAVGVSGFHKLLNVDQVDVVIVKRSAIGMPVSALAKQSGLPLLGLVGPEKFISDNPYTFRFYPNSASFGKALAEIGIKEGLKKIAVISTEDEWQISLKNSFVKAFQGDRNKVVMDESVSASDTDFRGLVARLKQIKPDSVLINSGPGQTGILARRIHEAGLQIKLLGNYYLKQPDEIKKAGSEAVEGAILVDISLGTKPGFLSLLKRLSPDIRADSAVYTCYTGMAMVLQTLARETGISGRESLYRALLKTNTIKTPDGELPVKGREIQYGLSCFSIANAEVVSCELDSSLN